MAQINITVDDTTAAELDKLAKLKGMKRTSLVHAVVLETLAAHHEGRPLFEPAPPPPTIKPGILVALATQLEKLIERLNSVLRAANKRDADLMNLAATNAEAIKHAETIMSAHLAGAVGEAMHPLRSRIDHIGTVTTDNQKAVLAHIDEHRRDVIKALTENPAYAKVAKELVLQRTAIEELRKSPRHKTVYQFGASDEIDGWSLSVWLFIGFLSSILVLLILARILPDSFVAKPVAGGMFGSTDRAACVLSGRVYENDFCRIGPR